MIEVGVAFALILVTQVVGEDFGCWNLRLVCPKNVGEFHGIQRVADGPSPTRRTTGVAVGGFVSPGPSHDCFS